MKKFLLRILGYGILTAIIVIPLAIMFADMFPIFVKLGGGSAVVGMFVAIFATIGGVNVFRGFVAVSEIDEGKYGRKMIKGWGFYVYTFFYVGGYLALFYAIRKL